MDDRDSLDRSSTELGQTTAAATSNGGGFPSFGGESPQGQQFPASAHDSSPLVDGVLQSEVRKDLGEVLIAADDVD